MSLKPFHSVVWLLSAVALLSLLTRQVHGQTPPSSHNKKPSLQSSAEHLTTWERLSAQFNLTLAAQEQTLTELSQKLKTSESSLEQSTLLLDTLSRQNEDLKSYNQQIAQRMQERDEDLASAYDRIDQLQKSNHVRLLIIIALGVSAAAVAAIFVIVRIA
jgi:peptidoglycan hydrolase CwlO-like protein